MKVPLPPHKSRLRAQRGSDCKLGELLGITAAHEDGLPDAQTGLLPPFNERGREREDENHAEQWRVPAAWSYAGSGVDTEEQPLIDAGTRDNDVEGRTKRKIGQKFVGLIPFRRRKENSGKQGTVTPTPHGRVTARRGSLSAESAQNPFGDEHAIAGGVGDATAQDEQMEVEMDTHDGLFPIPIPSTPSAGHSVVFPSLAAARTVTAPTTPKRSPRRRTPGSAKSWLSEVSNTSGGGLSAAGSLRRRSVRRQARLSGGHDAQIRSMRKTVQVLGPEAAGAVTKGTDVSPNKLRYMDFGRVLRQKMRRDL
ncbi:hypothetical protein V8D89_009874 [Ganoderma adspersum]